MLGTPDYKAGLRVAVLLISYSKRNDMKKILTLLMAGSFIAACNNSVDSKTDNDTVNLEQNRDINNRNTTVYDSAGNQSGIPVLMNACPLKSMTVHRNKLFCVSYKPSAHLIILSF